jgi:hypothetical protein
MIATNSPAAMCRSIPWRICTGRGPGAQGLGQTGDLDHESAPGYPAYSTWSTKDDACPRANDPQPPLARPQLARHPSLPHRFTDSHPSLASPLAARIARLAVTLSACGAPQAPPSVERSPPVAATPVADAPVILALGDSITAGLGLAQSQAWPTLLQARLDAAGRKYRVVNAGVSGDTTAAGLARLDWQLSQKPAW